MIKRYFLDYQWLSRDFTIELGSRHVEPLESQTESGWKVSLIDTGAVAMTGARVKRIEPYIDGDTFMLTYGDGVSDLDIGSLLRFHEAHGKIATVTGVSPPSRYGELGISGDQVVAFREKPPDDSASISGGYFVFKRAFFDYLSDDDSCVLEREPLERLTNDGQLKVFHHRGFWQCMDTPRDYEYLKGLWDQGDPAWRVWDE
jgi:glucose-1-phosphate cytidylyltransferase